MKLTHGSAYLRVALVSLGSACAVDPSASGAGGDGAIASSSVSGPSTATGNGEPSGDCLSATDEASCVALGCIYAPVTRFPLETLACDAGAPASVCTWHIDGGFQSTGLFYRDIDGHRDVITLGVIPPDVVGFERCHACCGEPDPCLCLDDP